MNKLHVVLYWPTQCSSTLTINTKWKTKTLNTSGTECVRFSSTKFRVKQLTILFCIHYAVNSRPTGIFQWFLSVYMSFINFLTIHLFLTVSYHKFGRQRHVNWSKKIKKMPICLQNLKLLRRFIPMQPLKTHEMMKLSAHHGFSLFHVWFRKFRSRIFSVPTCQDKVLNTCHHYPVISMPIRATQFDLPEFWRFCRTHIPRFFRDNYGRNWTCSHIKSVNLSIVLNARQPETTYKTINNVAVNVETVLEPYFKLLRIHHILIRTDVKCEIRSRGEQSSDGYVPSSRSSQSSSPLNMSYSWATRRVFFYKKKNNRKKYDRYGCRHCESQQPAAQRSENDRKRGKSIELHRRQAAPFCNLWKHNSGCITRTACSCLVRYTICQYFR